MILYFQKSITWRDLSEILPRMLAAMRGDDNPQDIILEFDMYLGFLHLAVNVIWAESQR